MSELGNNGASTACGWRAAAGLIARDGAFFVPFYLYVWLVVEPHLIFHGAGTITNFPAFYRTRHFFVEHLAYPGGPAEYLAAFGSQLFYHSWLGALAITVQAWMLYLCVSYLLRAAGFRPLALVGYVPPLLLSVLYGRYTYYGPTTVALLVALAFACLYVRPARREISRASPVVFLVASFLCYYAAGGAFLLFAAVCALHELLSRRRWALALVYAAVGAALPYVTGVLGFDVNPADAYARLTPVSWELLDYAARSRSVELVCALYLLVPATMAALGAVRIARTRLGGPGRARPKQPPRAKRTRFKAALSWYAAAPRLNWLVHRAALLAVAAVAAFGSLDRALKAQFAVDYYAHRRMWPEVMAAGARHSDDPLVMHAVDRALYHTGRLGNEMFRWPQRPQYLLLTGTEGKRVFWASVDAYLEIGFINGAEHALTECLEGLGGHPAVLQRLALVNLVKGNLGTARVYLGALSHTLFHGAWARHYLDFMDRNHDLAADASIQHLRSIALEQDVTTVVLEPEQMLRALLAKDGRNRMAFEYLMAWYLTTRQVVKLTQHLDGFRELGYAALPTHVEEAALVYVYGRNQKLYLGGYQPRAVLQQRVEHFRQAMGRYRGDKQAAWGELRKSHYGDYFFYYVYAPPEETE